MLCLSLEHQNVSDVAHALRISDQYDNHPAIRKYNLYVTCYGVYRGTAVPEEKLRVYGPDPVLVELPWNNNLQRAFVQWANPQWDKHNDRVLAPLAVVSVCEKVFTLGEGVKTHITTQGEGDDTTTNVVISYADADCLDANLTRYY